MTNPLKWLSPRRQARGGYRMIPTSHRPGKVAVIINDPDDQGERVVVRFDVGGIQDYAASSLSPGVDRAPLRFGERVTVSTLYFDGWEELRVVRSGLVDTMTEDFDDD